MIRASWARLNLRIRQGLPNGSYFENYNNKTQFTLMHIASITFTTIFTRKIEFINPVVNFLVPDLILEKDIVSVYKKTSLLSDLSNTVDEECSLSFAKFGKHVNELINLMRIDDEAVKTFRNVMRSLATSNSTKLQIDQSLRELGIVIDSEN